MPQEEFAFDRVVRAAFGEARDRRGIGGGIAVVFNSEKKNACPSMDHGGMRVLFGLHERMGFAMDGDPLSRIHSGKNPEPPSHRPACKRMELYAAMGHG